MTWFSAFASELVVWVLLSQVLAGLPQMPPGTEVRLVSRDLLTVYGSARVEDGRLEFSGPLVAGQELRLLVFPPDSTDRSGPQMLTRVPALPGRISDDGMDIEVEVPDSDEPLSLREWLSAERGIVLVMHASERTRRAP